MKLTQIIKSNPIIALLLIVSGGALALKAAELLLFHTVIENAFYGESFDYLNQLLERHRLRNPEERDLEFYLSEITLFTNRIIFLFSIVTFLSWFLIRNNFSIAKEFLFESSSPINLAVLRIAVTGFILFINFPSLASETASLGREAVIPPTGWAPVIDLIPLSENFVSSSGIIFILSGICAFLGFYTRISLITMTVLGFYIMGVPQFFGKIDHYHILWHVLLLLTFTRSGDAISIDKLRKSSSPPKKSVQYGFPLKIVMILIGLAYFFPGVWKFVFSGFEWAFSENLKFKMYSKWLEFDNWVPFFRIDHYPILYQSAAFLTLVLEIGFLFALFFKKVRPMFVIGGFMFHLSVHYFMGISFFSLMILYVVFIDWEKIWTKITSLFRQQSDKFAASNADSKISLPLKTVSSILIIGNIIFGSLLIDSWPFAINPTFATIESERVPTLLIREVNLDGSLNDEVVPLVKNNFHKPFESRVRLRGFLQSIVVSDTLMPTQSRLLINTWNDIRQVPDKKFHYEFYKIQLYTDPDHKLPKYELSEKIQKTEVH